MHTFETILIVFTAAILLSVLAERLLEMRLVGEISDAACYQIEEGLDRHAVAVMPIER